MVCERKLFRNQNVFVKKNFRLIF